MIRVACVNILVLSTCSLMVTVLPRSLRFIARKVRLPSMRRLLSVVCTGAFCICVTWHSSIVKLLFSSGMKFSISVWLLKFNCVLWCMLPIFNVTLSISCSNSSSICLLNGCFWSGTVDSASSSALLSYLRIVQSFVFRLHWNGLQPSFSEIGPVMHTLFTGIVPFSKDFAISLLSFFYSIRSLTASFSDWLPAISRGKERQSRQP